MCLTSYSPQNSGHLILSVFFPIRFNFHTTANSCTIFFSPSTTFYTRFFILKQNSCLDTILMKTFEIILLILLSYFAFPYQ